VTESKSFIRKIISNPVIQTLAIYVSSGWILIELLEYFIAYFNLNEQSRNILLVILLCGLPVALVIAWLVSRERESTKKHAQTGEEKAVHKSTRLFKRPALSIPLLVIGLSILIFGVRYFNHRAKIKWAKEKALPEIEQLRVKGEFTPAFNLLRKVEKYISDAPEFQEYQSILIRKLTILTDPPGADIYLRKYDDMDGVWDKRGVTPVDSLELPRASYYQVKIEKAGYEEVRAIASCYLDTFYRKLFPEGTMPQGMVYVDGYGEEVTGHHFQEKNGFFIDRYEVTNKQFKEFVEQGGYRSPEFWKHAFIKDGKELAWDEAMPELTDKSGRPGPATWEASDFPEGREDYPVSGISWYEAAAYAEFAGKSLPTAGHWATGAGLYYHMIEYYLSSSVIKNSNFHGKGSERAGKNRGLNAFGTYDMAGNVREWCWNETKSGHIIRGGGWDDAGYMYLNRSQLPAFDRSSKNGFRCVQYMDKDKIPEEAFLPVEFSAKRDYYAEEPVADNIFEIFRHQILYDSMALDAVIEERDNSPDDYIRERITFNAAYDDERVTAYLYLPKNSEPPFQTWLFFPGSYALSASEFDDDGIWFFDFLIKNGCAVIYPVYKGTFERNDGEEIPWGRTHQFTNWAVKWVKDFSRSVDYLETRPDIDSGKLGYLGHSWGGTMGGIIPSVEPRLKLSVLIVGGLSWREYYPEADVFNYLSRVTIPVLMLNGKYDSSFPFETTVKPFYDFLGTPDSDKRLFISETDHWIPKVDMIRETLNWMDRYFGPVK